MMDFSIKALSIKVFRGTGREADVEKFHTERKYGNMSLILNGTDGGGNRYGYKYGYHYGYAGYAKEE